jgi:phosphoribosylamine--glycine ligase
MKILLVSVHGAGLWFTLRLKREGFSVDSYLLDNKCKRILQGIIDPPLAIKPNFSNYDLVLFDSTGKPKLAEEAAQSVPVIGDSDFASALEDDRLFGLETMERCGIEVPPYEAFDSSQLGKAKSFIQKNRDKKYVFKPFTTTGKEQDTATTYKSEGTEDLLEYIDKLEELSHNSEFILQEVVQGTEISTEGWFDGEEFYLINSTLEEKKFMNDGIGPNTGCAGNIVWTYGQNPRIFKAGLAKITPLLQDIEYTGMIDLNTIVNNSHVWGLEWTPRFGYDATATLFHAISSDMGEFLFRIATGDGYEPRISSPFSASARVTIPPYPSECDEYYHENVPINGVEQKDLEDIYMYDACIQNSDLVTCGWSGDVCSVMGRGQGFDSAWHFVEERIKKIKIPDMQYRTDLCKCTNRRFQELSCMGYLK